MRACWVRFRSWRRFAGDERAIVISEHGAVQSRTGRARAVGGDRSRPPARAGRGDVRSSSELPVSRGVMRSGKIGGRPVKFHCLRRLAGE